MYGSYGSYSVMPFGKDMMRRPLSSPTLDASCVFPSWPRRSSLSASDGEESPSSYLSDEDLFFGISSAATAAKDRADSVSSAGSGASPQMRPTTDGNGEELELERERAAYQREVVRFLLHEKEKERRRLQAMRRAAAMATTTASSSTRRSSPKSKLSAMTPVAECEAAAAPRSDRTEAPCM